MECIHCNKSFKTTSNLKYHQKTAKYCLIKRGIIEENPIIIENYNCKYCDKILSTKANLERHLECCNLKFEKICNELAIVKQEVQNIKFEKMNYERQLQEKDKQIEKLQNTIASIATQPKIINNNNRNNTTTNRLNIINNLVPITDNEFEKLPDMLKQEYVESGLDGYVKLATEFYKDKAVCTDVSRKIVTHKDENGKVVTDPNMSRLNTRFFKAILNKNRELTYVLVEEIEKKVDSKEMNIDDLINYSCKYSNQRLNVIKLANGEEIGELNDTDGEYLEFKNTYTNLVCDSISLKK